MNDPEFERLLKAFPMPSLERGVFCNRTLNLRSIGAIGYDMDYTLIHYRVDVWEQEAYDDTRLKLQSLGWPVADLRFDPELVVRGLVIDIELGNLLKVDRFGLVRQATHGTRSLSYEDVRNTYYGVVVDLSESRFVFLNTLFSLSEGCLYAQLVDLLDEKRIPGPLGYPTLYTRVRSLIDETHVEGQLKAKIVADPDRFVELDPELPLTLIDQRNAGKKLLLITNSDWSYSSAMMSYALDSFLPSGMTWRSLFDLVIVSAGKPDFFLKAHPMFEIVSPDGLLRPWNAIPEPGKAYVGGGAVQIEKALGLSGDEILYVGDHIYADVHVSKSLLRWRTALVVRELEQELAALGAFQDSEQRLAELMAAKERLEFVFSQLRIRQQRIKLDYGPPASATDIDASPAMQALRDRLVKLDAEIAPLARTSGELMNRRWGLLLRAGKDKSHLARQLERSADIYTSRVSNLLFQTPFVYLRSPRASLPHDPVQEQNPSYTARRGSRAPKS